MSYNPFLGANPIVKNMERARSRREQVRENGARDASCYATYTSEGVGEFMVPEKVVFEATFVRRPEVTHGFSIEGDTLIKGAFPIASGGVYKWDRDSRGYYTGCYVFLTVSLTAATLTKQYSLDLSGADTYTIAHDFSFHGVAIKDLPAYLVADL